MSAGLDLEFLADWGLRFLGCWNDGDGDGVAALCSEDIVWHDAGLTEPARGRDGVRGFVEDTLRAFPDFRVEPRGLPFVSAAEPVALSPYRFSGTMRGPWKPLGMAPTGARISVPGVDEYHFRDGLLRCYDTYYDSIDMARQMRVLPSVGGVGDRFSRRLQPVLAGLQRRGIL